MLENSITEKEKIYYFCKGMETSSNLKNYDSKKTITIILKYIESLKNEKELS